MGAESTDELVPLAERGVGVWQRLVSVTEGGASGNAEPACAARPQQVGDDVISDLDSGHAGADLFNDSPSLVTRDERHREPEVVIDGSQVAMADAAGLPAHQDLVL